MRYWCYLLFVYCLLLFMLLLTWKSDCTHPRDVLISPWSSRSRLLSVSPVHWGLLGAAQHQTVGSVSGPGVPSGSRALRPDVGGGWLLLQLLQLPHGPQVSWSCLACHMSESSFSVLPKKLDYCAKLQELQLNQSVSLLLTATTWRAALGTRFPSAAAPSTDTDTRWLCIRYGCCSLDPVCYHLARYF